MTIRIEGLRELVNKLGQVEGMEALREPMQRALLRLQNRMATYPPAIKGSSYIRGYGYPGRPTSEQLGKRWTTARPEITSAGDGIQGRIGNTASYAKKVQSRLEQAPIHRGRWQTAEDVLEQETPAIVSDFEQAIDDALNRKK